MIDKVSMNLLKALYKEDLPEEEVNQIIGRTNADQPDERISFLWSEKLIEIHEDGERDPEGGLVPETVVRTYRIRQKGRAIVEQANKEGIDKWLDRLGNLIP